MSRNYARAPLGERAIAKEPVKKSTNHTLVGALSLNGLETSMLLEGAMDGASFLAFINHFLAPIIGTKTIVVMDNLPAHKVAGVRERIEKTGAKLIYLPPYSPELNPIEECWSKVKNLVRSTRPSTQKDLLKKLADAINLVTDKNCRGWFKHAGYCI